MWFDGFASPWLAESRRRFHHRGPTFVGSWRGAELRPPALGWALFGIAALRARVFPTAAALGLILGGLIASSRASRPTARRSLAVAAVGGWLIRSDRAWARNGNVAVTGCLLGGRAHFEPPAEGVHAVGEALQPVPGWDRPPAVVGDRDDDGAIAARADRDRRGLRVLGYVGQCLRRHETPRTHRLGQPRAFLGEDGRGFAARWASASRATSRPCPSGRMDAGELAQLSRMRRSSLGAHELLGLRRVATDLALNQ